MHQHYMRLTGQDALIESNVQKYVDGEALSQHYLAVRDSG